MITRSTITRILGIAVAVILVIAVIILSITAAKMNHRIDVLSKQVDQTNSLRLAVSGLQGEIDTLNKPNDPLSAYNQVCQNNNTLNDATGVTQTYYYPCTNRIIPASG